MRYHLPDEATTALVVVNTLLNRLTSWELTLGRISQDEPELGGQWVYVIRNEEKANVFIAGRVG